MVGTSAFAASLDTSSVELQPQDEGMKLFAAKIFDSPMAAILIAQGYCQGCGPE